MNPRRTQEAETVLEAHQNGLLPVLDGGRVCAIVNGVQPETSRAGPIGREQELAQLSTFLEQERLGAEALLLEGEPGIGKSTLWRAAVDSARSGGYRVLEARPAEPERGLSFSALADLLEGVPFQDLPPPLEEALRASLLTGPASGGDAHAVARGVLRLLARLAAERPLLVAVDDAQWMDPPSSRALAFAMRRLEASPVAVVAAVRGPHLGPAPAALADVPLLRLSVGPMSLAAVQRLLRLRLEVAIPRPVLLRLYAVSGGNPFYALELARALPAEVVPGQPLPVPASIGELPRRRIARLPRRTRNALLAAAALSSPTVAVLRTVVPGVSRSELEEAERRGIVEIKGERVRFSHPLFASAQYDASPPAARRQLHRRLADVVEDGEERALHLALGCEAPDADVAAALDDAARAAQARGAPDSAASLLEHAVRLTPGSAAHARRRRMLGAADAWRAAAAFQRARELLEQLEAELGRGHERAEVLHRLAIVSLDDYGKAINRCEQALRESEHDLALAVSIERQLRELWSNNGDQQRSLEHAERALALADALGDPHEQAAALAALSQAQFFGAGMIRLDLFERALELERRLRLVGYYAPSTQHACALMWADMLDGARPLLEEQMRSCAARGLEEDRLGIVFHLADLELRAGRLDRAELLTEELSEGARQLADDQANSYAAFLEALVALRRGRHDQVRAPALRAEAIAAALGDPFIVAGAAIALGAAELADGDAESAYERLEPHPRKFAEMGFGNLGAWFTEVWALPAEALVALGRLDEADEAAADLEARARELDRPVAIARALHVRALARAASGELDEALRLVDEALEQHARRPLPFERARTLLLAGSLDRRARRKAKARERLAAARRLFEEAGAEPWAERARLEAARIGGRPTPPDELTAAEQEVVRMVVAGATNKEVAQALFMSVKTVEAHLGHVYRKLGVHSRRELARLPLVLGQRGQT